MKATLFIFLILGAVFFFAGNQVLTVGDLVLVLVIFWLWHWQAKKRVKEQEEQKEQQRIEAFNADYKPPAEQDVAELNEWRKSQGYPPLSAWELGARSVLPSAELLILHHMHQFMSDQSAVNRAIFKHDAMPESDPACFVSYQLCLFY